MAVCMVVSYLASYLLIKLMKVYFVESGWKTRTAQYIIIYLFNGGSKEIIFNAFCYCFI